MRRDTRGFGDRFGLVGLAVLALGLAMGSLLARGARADAPIPRTPAGAALEWSLSSVNAGALPTVEDIEARFTPEFLAQVPPAQLLNTTKGLRTQLGSLEVREVREESAHRLMATVHSSKADAPFAVHAGTEQAPPHRVSALFIRPLPRPAPAGDTWLKIDEDLVALGERVSFAAMRVNGDAGFVPVHMLHEDESLAIGSTFKLWILGALGEAVRAGDLRFEDTLAVRDEWKSLPSGTMQFEPAGKAFTLREYAEKMISISDNTATDHLLYAVGRENAGGSCAVREGLGAERPDAVDAGHVRDETGCGHDAAGPVSGGGRVGSSSDARRRGADGGAEPAAVVADAAADRHAGVVRERGGVVRDDRVAGARGRGGGDVGVDGRDVAEPRDRAGPRAVERVRVQGRERAGRDEPDVVAPARGRCEFTLSVGVNDTARPNRRRS